jgi:phage major head subunit gpT-like protein
MDSFKRRRKRKLEKLKIRRKETAEKIKEAMSSNDSALIGKLCDFHEWLNERIRKIETKKENK